MSCTDAIDLVAPTAGASTVVATGMAPVRTAVTQIHATLSLAAATALGTTAADGRHFQSSSTDSYGYAMAVA